MESASPTEIEQALRLLQSTRERARRCYEKHKEERKAKRREYYWKKKEQASSKPEAVEGG